MRGMQNLDILNEVIRIAGGQTELARRLGIKQANVWNWINRARGVIPPDQVIPVARAIDWQKTPHEIDPDLYPNPTDGLPVEVLVRRQMMLTAAAA